MIRHHATVAPMAPAVDFGGRSMTYADLDRIADRIAATLAAMGLAPGGRVLWLGKNTDGLARIVAGVARPRVVGVPINCRRHRPGERFLAADRGEALEREGRAAPPTLTARPTVSAHQSPAGSTGRRARN